VGEPLSVLWEDLHGLAVDKPAGLLTQGSPDGEETLEGWVREYLKPHDPASTYLGTVHRLDRPVSGAILWAKNPKAARRWSEDFRARRVQKVYWALVEVHPGAKLDPSGTWDDPLASPDRQGVARVSNSEGPGLVRATTRYELGRGREVAEGLAWLVLRPETGRTHQLRAQAASRGMPIVGDATYGSTRVFPKGIALHARRLAVSHPISRRPVVVEAPLPGSWSGGLGEDSKS